MRLELSCALYLDLFLYLYLFRNSSPSAAVIVQFRVEEWNEKNEKKNATNEAADDRQAEPEIQQAPRV